MNVSFDSKLQAGLASVWKGTSSEPGAGHPFLVDLGFVLCRRDCNRLACRALSVESLASGTRECNDESYTK